MDLFEWASEAQPSSVLTAERAADEAIERVGRNADPNWKQAALEAVCIIALDRRQRFTTDDVWELLDQQGVRATHEPRALGAVIRTAQSKGLIQSTGEYVKSKRIECHGRPVMVWEGTA